MTASAVLADPQAPAAQRVVALTLAVAGDATVPHEVTESAETRFALARARVDAADYDAAAVVLADLAANDPSDWRVAWYTGLRELASRGRSGAQVAQGAFGAVFDEPPGELAPKLALAFAAEAAGGLTAAERSYRALARLTPDEARRIELVDLANAIRPRTLT
jgi:serine/threonine-protein kinase PknG